MEHMVLESGYENVNIKEIADFLDMPRSLIYYYFKSKKDIMIAIYQAHYTKLDAAVSELIPKGENPVVRMLVKYITFKRFIIMNPLFTEFILMFPTYASQGPDAVSRNREDYYHESYEAFCYYGLPADGNEFQAHVLMIDAVSRALNQGIYNGTLTFSIRELMEYFGEHTIMVTFGFSREQFHELLDRAFFLADQLNKL